MKRITVAAMFLIVGAFVTGCASPSDRLAAAIRQNDTAAIQRVLADPNVGHHALRKAVQTKDLATAESILQNLRLMRKLDEALAIPKDYILEYDAEFTAAQNDGFTYLAVLTLPATDLLYTAITNRDEAMARLLLKAGAPTGHVFHIDKSGLDGWGYMTKAEILAPGVGTVQSVATDGTQRTLEKKSGRVKTKSDRKKGVFYETCTHAALARKLGLNVLADEIEPAVKSQAVK